MRSKRHRRTVILLRTAMFSLLLSAAAVAILGVGGIIANMSDDGIKAACEGEATASMCKSFLHCDDFVIEQDIAHTCDSVNL